MDGADGAFNNFLKFRPLFKSCNIWAFEIFYALNKPFQSMVSHHIDIDFWIIFLDGCDCIFQHTSLCLVS